LTLPPVEFSLKCISCGESLGSEAKDLTCPACGGALEVLYDYERLRNTHGGLPVDSSILGVWRYSPILPMTAKTRPITLGEGGTPLTKAERIGDSLGVGKVYVKDDSRNPTLSFKDRKSSVAISKASEFGAHAVASMTAGNAGSSIAAYAAKAKILAYIFTIEGISESKLAKLLSYGAHVLRTKAPTKELMTFVGEVCKRYGMMNLTAASRYNPYVKEGAKTSTFEVYESMNRSLPDWFVIPVGGGGNLTSIYKGLRELRSLGLVERIPRIVGVQGRYCAPVVEAFEKGLRPEEVPVVQGAHTVAHSILDSWAPDGDQALRAIRETNGQALGVTDEEIIDAMKTLSKEEGLFLEPASAAPLAALRRMVEAGVVDRDESVVLFATGSGSNQPEATIDAWGRPPEIGLDLEGFGRFLEH
jgi:threonine synthase